MKADVDRTPVQCDLAFDVLAGLAEVGETHRSIVDLMQRGLHTVQFVIVRSARGGRHSGQGRIPENAAVDVFHQVEGRADDALVLAQAMSAGHGNSRSPERRDHAELALHGMRGREELRRRPGLGPEHVVFSLGVDLIRGVRLAALELPYGERPGKAVLAEIALQRSHVEALVLLDRHRAGELPVQGRDAAVIRAP